LGGTWAGGLNLYNRQTKTFTRFLHDKNNPKTISSNNIFGMAEDENGYLWIATMGGGLNRFESKTHEFLNFKVDNTGSNSISGNWVHAILETSNHELWVSTTGGVDIFNHESERFTNFKHDSADSKSISYDGANVLFEDSKKNIWLGTDVGLNFFVRIDSSFICYSIEDGLPDNSVQGICEDNSGSLWISTNNGISKYINGINRPVKPVFKNYNKSDGLQGNEFIKHSCYKGKDGTIYFGGLNGFNSFKPDNIKENLFIPEVKFTYLLIFNEPVEIGLSNSPLKKQLSESSEIILSHKQSVFTIGFTALNYIAPKENQFAFILEGFEKDWNYVGNKREATYTNLDPGKYIFKVKASNNDGIWNEKGVSLQIVVLPPWWMTAWFRILAFLIVLSSLIGFYLIRVNSLNKQKNQLEKLVKKRTNEIEAKNTILFKQTTVLNESNVLLEERQQQIEEQNKTLIRQAEKLNEANTLLEERQEEITLQNEELEKHRNHLELLVEERTSELVKAKTKAEESDKLKSSFLSNVSHEIRTPMNAILGFTSLLNKEFLSKEKKTKYINIINENCEALLVLIDDILDISSIEVDRLAFTNEKFNVDSILINLETFYKLNNNKSIELEFINKNQEDGLFIYNDKVRFRQIITNLLNNSFKYTESGKIEFGYEVIEKFVRFFVSDTGVGIDKSEIDKVFDHFYKIENNPDVLYRGTGIGLALCKKLVAIMGGEIWVKSILNQGSVFYFTLPCDNDIMPSRDQKKKRT